MSKLKFDTWENPDGTENFKCRAWVNFNGTGTVAIRAAGNVDLIVDGGVGTYTIYFENVMPDENYVVSGLSISAAISSISYGGAVIPLGAPLIDRFRVGYQALGTISGYTGQRRDVSHIMVSVFR